MTIQVPGDFSQSLTEVNALLDSLRVLKTQYVAPLGVALPLEQPAQTRELVDQSKVFQWVTRRRVRSTSFVLAS